MLEGIADRDSIQIFNLCQPSTLNAFEITLTRTAIESILFQCACRIGYLYTCAMLGRVVVEIDI